MVWMPERAEPRQYLGGTVRWSKAIRWQHGAEGWPLDRKPHHIGR